jgi:hypothetical protein
MEEPISFWGYKEQESNLILPEHDGDDDDDVSIFLPICTIGTAVKVMRKYCGDKFYILLNVHLGIILVNNQHDAQFFLCMFVSVLFISILSWMRHCATSLKVAGSIPDGVIGIFHWHNPSGRTMALGSTQPLPEMSTRNISWG